MPFSANPDRPRESWQARVALADLARFALEIGGDFGIAPQIDSERYVSRAALIFARTHAAPPPASSQIVTVVEWSLMIGLSPAQWATAEI